jgi:5-methylcytosine-specific restriction enzyme A
MTAKPWANLYRTALWRQGRLVHLMEYPLCARCLRNNCLTQATVVHHIKEHRGDWDLFSDPTNWESRCGPCHNRIEQAIESRGYDSAVGADGWPEDPKHPLYTGLKPARRLPVHIPEPPEGYSGRPVLVWGPPGSGRMEAVLKACGPNDLITGPDCTVPARNATILSAAAGRKCWIVTDAPRAQNRDDWHHAFGARLEMMRVWRPLRECLRRAPSKRDHVHAWFMAADK